MVRLVAVWWPPCLDLQCSIWHIPPCTFLSLGFLQSFSLRSSWVYPSAPLVPWMSRWHVEYTGVQSSRSYFTFHNIADFSQLFTIHGFKISMPTNHSQAFLHCIPTEDNSGNLRLHLGIWYSCSWIHFDTLDVLYRSKYDTFGLRLS